METLIKFSWIDLERFSQSSGDYNPLHISRNYARRTPYGSPVVFGILGGIRILKIFPDRPNLRLAAISFDFAGAIQLDALYRLQIANKGSQTIAKLFDGKRLLLKLKASFQAGKSLSNWKADSYFGVASPLLRDISQLGIGETVSGIYAPQLTYLNELINSQNFPQKGIDASHLATLLWTSYLVGMELPGQQALFSKLKLEFPKSNNVVSGPLTYSATVNEIDERFQMLRIVSQVEANDSILATADIRAFVRSTSPPCQIQAIANMLPASNYLKGRVALVIGGSRGLGAAIATALAQQGCTTLINFHQSLEEAINLRQDLKNFAGEIILLQGDAANTDWCITVLEKIKTTYGRLDYLICNASPPIRPIWLQPEALPRIYNFIEESLALMGTPMASFLELLAAHQGWNIVISSIYVTATAPPDLPHYLIAKSAIEGLVKAALLEYEEVQHCILRPPKLLTDQTNTPLSSQGAIPPEIVAVRLAKTLINDKAKPSKSEVLIMENFPLIDQ